MLKYFFSRKLVNLPHINKLNRNIIRYSTSSILLEDDEEQQQYNQASTVYKKNKPVKAFAVMNETNYVYNIINPNKRYKFPSEDTSLTDKEFQNILKQNWRKSTASEIVKAFQDLLPYCTKNNINISDIRFNNLIDGLMDHCEKLTVVELYDLLYCLTKYPRCHSFVAHNMHDTWSCLDDICLWKWSSMNVDQMLQFCDLWFELGLARYSDFIRKTVDRLTKKANSLSTNQLLRIFFYFNVMRTMKVPYEYQHALQFHVKNMTVDELAAIALGFFKSQSKVKLLTILEAMINSVIENSKTVHEISLTAILKIIGYSHSGTLVNEVHAMLDSIYPEMERVSTLCQLHIALVCTFIQKYHRDTLTKASQLLVKEIHDVSKIRLKDIERLLISLTMFDFDPKTEPDVFQAAYKELHNEKRTAEFEMFPKCICCSLYFLSLRNIYAYDLMNKVLNMNFVNETYGKEIKDFPKELFFLDNSIDIECKDYKGNRLPLNVKQRAVKWLITFPPSEKQNAKLTHADKLFVDVVEQVKKIVKDDKYFVIDHVLPHFDRADIILCKDKATCNFIEPPGLDKYILGEVKFPQRTNELEWFAVVVVGWNHTIRDSSMLLGNMITKQRQLKKIGFTPIMVIWNQFILLKDAEKYRYLFHKMRI